MQQLISADDVVTVLADALQCVVNRRHVRLERVAGLAAAREGDLAFCNAEGADAARALAGARASLVIARADVLNDIGDTLPGGVMFIGVERPRLQFVRAWHALFATPAPAAVHESAVIAAKASIDASVSIGAHATIGNDVAIGRGSRIGAGVFVGDGTRIGEDCDIHANAVIGEPGFGFERDERGCALQFPHLGRVVIGDRVTVGANSCIARGALTDTIIEDDVQIDSHVHIAHNVHVQRGVTIVAHSSISGSAVIEQDVWLAPGSLVLGTTVGAGAKVGVGAVVTKAVERAVTVFGNPARVLWRKP